MQPTQTILNQAEPVRPWYRHRWPWLIMLGPAAVIVAGIHTTWIAFTMQDALVVDDYYKQGKAINMDLRRDRVAASLQMRMSLRYDAAAGKLLGSVSGISRDVKLKISLIHSTQPDKDVKLIAHPDQDGHFAVDLPLLDMARWQVLVENENRDWRLNGAWSWPQQKQVELTSE